MKHAPNPYFDRLIQEAYEDGQRDGYIKSLIMFFAILILFAIGQQF